ncbi:hypothetical protein FISHEDRAFT_50360 [Fistulina hepatica ATCC 64428]|uniref:Flavin reductase like domain-containing protein n=1 Tax=Fistulina hepatica ATCC 64428 TaxID=1128425 RepID=A0A0D7A1R6_9AGAR|nr:hypothetical protein FISHEDRAFT_50360 [Fistulina hepatica ATCC 64428]
MFIFRPLVNALRYPRSCHLHTVSSRSTVQDQLRSVLRETAQPVAVVASRPDGVTASLHGATLSSFTSIAMDPHPLVSFALRLPSRMSASLKDAYSRGDALLTISLLSSIQKDVAIMFSRPDLYPAPFQSVECELTPENLPKFPHALGALVCRLVSPAVPLYDMNFLDALMREGQSRPLAVVPPLSAGSVISELFIAQVLRVEAGSGVSPLLYYRRKYTTCVDPKRP